jgi:hypothetical protein
VTLSKTAGYVIGAILFLSLALGSYEWLQERDARVRAEATQTAQDQVIKTSQAAITQAKADQAQTAANLQAQLAAIANQRTIVVTPQQAVAAIPAIVPNLPQPVTVQTTPATATAPATQQIVVPQADIPAFQAYKLNCDESNARLLACSKDAIDFKAELAATENKYEAEQITAASWEASAEGGTWIHRTLTAAKWIAIGAGVGYASGKLAK